MGARSDDIVAEATRIVQEAAARGVTIRMLGGIGVFMRCPDASSRPELKRAYKDIDCAAARRSSRSVRDFLTQQGYTPNNHFNAVHGSSRLLYYDTEHGRQVDVFLGSFEMCHKLDLEDRIALAGSALSPSDLFLLKLQIVQLNAKDVTDALTLLLQYEPVAEDLPDALSTTYIARLCAQDWGWYTTLHDNVEAVRAHAPEILVQQADLKRVQSATEVLLAAMESAPKSFGWKLRDKIGRRKVWYELPEEVDR
jgi:hypothetical protein